jgi:hypothetical protein
MRKVSVISSTVGCLPFVATASSSCSKEERRLQLVSSPCVSVHAFGTLRYESGLVWCGALDPVCYGVCPPTRAESIISPSTTFGALRIEALRPEPPPEYHLEPNMRMRESVHYITRRNLVGDCGSLRPESLILGAWGDRIRDKSILQWGHCSRAALFTVTSSSLLVLARGAAVDRQMKAQCF